MRLVNELLVAVVRAVLVTDAWGVAGTDDFFRGSCWQAMGR